MNFDDFEITQKLLIQSSFVIDEARYDKDSFGSWFIYVRLNPRLGIVWDGKDGWLYIRRETSEIFNGFHVWDNLWICKQPCDQIPQIAVDKMKDLSK